MILKSIIERNKNVRKREIKIMKDKDKRETSD